MLALPEALGQLLGLGRGVNPALPPRKAMTHRQLPACEKMSVTRVRDRPNPTSRLAAPAGLRPGWGHPEKAPG